MKITSFADYKGVIKGHSIFLNLKFFTTLLILFFTFIFCACSDPSSGSSNKEIWVGTWTTAVQLVETRNNPPSPGLSNNTLRQVVRVSLGGDSIRVKFSNEYGTSPVTINAVHIAVSAGASAIDTTTDTNLKFNGESFVTMQPGFTATSDPFRFMLEPRSDVTITIYFGETSSDVTGHPGSRTTSYIRTGNDVSAPVFQSSTRADRWYIINSIDVVSPAKTAAVAVIGNSITDGRGSGTNKQNRWPDELARRLQENPATQHIAVLNQGIGGNCVVRESSSCLGPNAVIRFNRDVVEAPGVKWLIMFEGINDIGLAQGADDANQIAIDLIDAYQQMIDDAHAAHIQVFGATILPFKSSFYYTDYREVARDSVNSWIRNSGQFDAVIDMDMALRSPTDSLRLLPAIDDGDHLHTNEAGHQKMAETVDLTLFK